MENQIKLFRLCTGEELIGKMTKMNNSHYFVRDITILIPTQSNSLGLAPFMPYAKTDESGVVFHEKDIMFMLDPIDDLANRYKEIHGDLLIPSEKKIIL